MITLLMFAWFPVAVYIFIRLPPQRALILSFIGAWLFLPLAQIKLPAVPAEYTKISSTCLAALLATTLYDFDRLKAFKFHWFDLPITIWCLCDFASSITNGLGPYDGFSGSVSRLAVWGLPYFLGRIYLNNFNGIRQLAVGIFVGGVVYVPFCLFEIVAHVNLHGLIYRFMVLTQSSIFSIRYGGYRPTVFLNSGLMLGTWMMFATLMGVVLWKTKVIRQIRGIPMGQLVSALLVTFILVKATGAYFLLIASLAILFTAQLYGMSLLWWLSVGGIIGYLYLGVMGDFPGQEIINFLELFIDPERLQSLGFRFMNEEILSTKARQQILFGWGGFGRNLIYNAEGYPVTITDSLWIIALGQNGLIGLASIFATILLPPLSFWSLYPPKTWKDPNVIVAAAIAVGLVMYALDCVVNAMVNPVFTLACGGLTGLIITQRQQGDSMRTVVNRRVPMEAVNRE